ncbi:MAG: HRDC domain-containing protein [Planctomycetia bacterium]|nr:HRDC domain-containing protein [Planctomycetia bacterium]
MSFITIGTQSELANFCERLRSAEYIAFDTEFVSEHSYRTQLCLVQVAIPGLTAVIDPLSIDDMRPFWDAVVAPGHQTIVHAGREEIVFSLAATGRPPHNLIDVQLAAGLMGVEFPAGYGTLASRLLGKRINKAETRTDWRRRPLTAQQVAYALSDVEHLAALRDLILGKLESLGRLDWLHTETASWLAEIEASRGKERWRRVSGSSGLSRRRLAIVREIWRWREEEAERRDCPARRVLRDDLIVELAKRELADPNKIRAVRGLERGDLKYALPKLTACIERALHLPESDCPEIVRTETNPQQTMVTQLLSSALGSICRQAQVAPSLVGTANDVRDLVSFHLGDLGESAEPPLLTQGWRAGVVGEVLKDLLLGRTTLHIVDPRAEQPLAFEPRKTS